MSSLLETSINDTKIASNSNGNTMLILRTVGAPLFILSLVVGLFGNITLIYIILANKYMRTKSNVLIVSLAVGDLLFLLITVPLALNIFFETTWIYGLAICKLSEFLTTLSTSASVLTLTALSGERFVAIVFPLYVYRIGSIRRAVLVSIAIWAFSLLVSLPDLVTSHLHVVPKINGTVTFCTAYPQDIEGYKHFRVNFRFALHFAFPLLLITIFYTAIAIKLLMTGRSQQASANVILCQPVLTATARFSIATYNSEIAGRSSPDPFGRQAETRRKVASTVLLFVVVFVVCWLPRHVYLLAAHYVKDPYNPSWAILGLAAYELMFTYSALNPFALYVINEQFRRHFNHYLCGLCFRSRRLRSTDRRGTLTTTLATATGNGQRLSSLAAVVIALDDLREFRERHAMQTGL